MVPLRWIILADGSGEVINNDNCEYWNISISSSKFIDSRKVANGLYYVINLMVYIMGLAEGIESVFLNHGFYKIKIDHKPVNNLCKYFKNLMDKLSIREERDFGTSDRLKKSWQNVNWSLWFKVRIGTAWLQELYERLVPNQYFFVNPYDWQQTFVKLWWGRVFVEKNINLNIG